MGTKIRMSLRPGAPNEIQPIWRSEGKANRDLRKSWERGEHYFQVDEPFGPITFRVDDHAFLVTTSGPEIPTVEMIYRRHAVKNREPIRIDGVAGTVAYPHGVFRARRRYEVGVGDRRWVAQRRRLGRVVFTREDPAIDLFSDVVGLGLWGSLSTIDQRGHYAPITGAVDDRADPTDMAVLATLRFVGWGSLWQVRMPSHAGSRL